MKRFLLALGLLGTLALAFGQNYPQRPITLIVPWAAGGGTDLVARALAGALEQELGQPVRVVNREGGGGVVGHTAIAQATPDGYTIGLATIEIVMMHWQGLTTLSYEDFTPIALVNFDAAAVSVRQDSELATVDELITTAEEIPGQLLASGTARGGIWDLARAGMLQTVGLEETAITWVPSAGAAPGFQELIAGGVNVVFSSLAEAGALIRAGEVRALAVMAEERLEGFPEVPTLEEQGIDWTIGAWRGVMGPEGLPADVVETLSEAVANAVQSESFTALMQTSSFGIRYLDTEEFTEFLASEDATMGELMQAVGLAE